MNKYKIRLFLLFATIISILFSVIACTNNITKTSEYHIDIISGGGIIDSATLTELHMLPEASFEWEGKTETGPTLLSVLNQAGIEDFQTVTIKGLLRGRLASTELELNKNQITGQVILEFNNKGKTKLCGPDISSDTWVIDVEQIVIK